MTREQAIKELTELLPEEFLSEYADAIKMGIESLEQEPCGDCISRQAVIEVIRKCHCEEWVKADIGAPIEVLPSVTPQIKMGHWKRCLVRGQVVDICSVCGLSNGTIYLYNYCPNCGAKMEGI